MGYVLSDLSYGEGEMNTYDLYVPSSLSQGQPCSLIVLIHGDGFTAGDKSEGIHWCRYFASKGILSASINYTLLTGDGVNGLPLQYQEVEEAVEAIYEKAGTLGFTVTEMATTGGSAGGTLALMYAYNQPEDAPIPVRFVFEQVGPCTFYPKGWGNTTDEEKAAFITMMFGQRITAEMVTSGEAQQVVDAISPVAYVDEDTVPSLLAYGLKDNVVPPALRLRLLEMLEKYGVPYDYVEFPNSGHGLLNDPDKMEEYVDCINTYISIMKSICRATAKEKSQRGGQAVARLSAAHPVRDPLLLLCGGVPRTDGHLRQAGRFPCILHAQRPVPGQELWEELPLRVMEETDLDSLRGA